MTMHDGNEVLVGAFLNCCTGLFFWSAVTVSLLQYASSRMMHSIFLANIVVLQQFRNAPEAKRP
ncbi:MAG: hypothetical protein SCARUB_03601 [Candidatus Scalindua rubra]|uniref:Uncharacterized protein n=1 Tax=Candidatus Scalindua rubra TaxID=1872076 RepID=A0A1E3X6Q5_9BACT|nr:MAG: hypothetical protein SCARUB_03601 [Candidatus Scalindua rubra]